MVRLILSGIQTILQTPVESLPPKCSVSNSSFQHKGGLRAVLFSKQTTVCREINTTFKIHSNNIDDIKKEIKERQKQSDKRQGGKINTRNP